MKRRLARNGERAPSRHLRDALARFSGAQRSGYTPTMSNYCAFCVGNPVHGPYHDTEHGFPSRDETVLFERLGMEIMQAGLSWEIVLKRRAGMRAAFFGWDVDAVAAIDAAGQAALLADPRIVRNRLKVAAIIHNAQVVQGFRASHGGFAAWVDAHHPRD
jgi:DNA-3-methyladenine glycosylase I